MAMREVRVEEPSIYRGGPDTTVSIWPRGVAGSNTQTGQLVEDGWKAVCISRTGIMHKPVREIAIA